MTGGPVERSGAGRRGLLVLAFALAAMAPSIGTLGAAWLAEDAIVVARLSAEGPWSDWNRPWFGAEIVRFWRPLVSLTWWLQLVTTGLDPLALRAFNLALHAACALLAWGAARRLGAGAWAAALAALWVAWFPAQGGTVTWLSGRTDLLVGFWLLASVYTVLGPRAWLAAPCAFLAASSKEFGFLAPLWCVLALRAQAVDWRPALVRTLPVLLAGTLAFVWRGLALDGFGGGYSGALAGPGAGALGAARVLAEHAKSLATGVPLVLLVLAAWPLRTECARAWPLLLAALLALVPLHPLLADGVLEPQNQRLFFVPSLALALFLARLLAPLAAPRLGVLALAVLAGRAVAAWRDTHAWSHAAEVSAEAIEAARARVAALPSGDAPALVRDLPTHVGPAYALGFGVSERFAAPFPVAPRPVWPWRLLFVDDPQRRREPLCVPRADGLVLPLDEALRVAPVELELDGSAAGAVWLDERIFPRGPDRSPVLTLSGGPPGSALELFVATPIGYEVFPAGQLDAAGEARASLREVFALSNGIALVADTFLQATDLGARRAYLEFRALAPDGSAVAASRWFELGWSAELPRR